MDYELNLKSLYLYVDMYIHTGIVRPKKKREYKYNCVRIVKYGENETSIKFLRKPVEGNKSVLINHIILK